MVMQISTANSRLRVDFDQRFERGSAHIDEAGERHAVRVGTCRSPLVVTEGAPLVSL